MTIRSSFEHKDAGEVHEAFTLGPVGVGPDSDGAAVAGGGDIDGGDG